MSVELWESIFAITLILTAVMLTALLCVIGYRRNDKND